MDYKLQFSLVFSLWHLTSGDVPVDGVGGNPQPPSRSVSTSPRPRVHTRRSTSTSPHRRPSREPSRRDPSRSRAVFIRSPVRVLYEPRRSSHPGSVLCGSSPSPPEKPIMDQIVNRQPHPFLHPFCLPRGSLTVRRSSPCYRRG